MNALVQMNSAIQPVNHAAAVLSAVRTQKHIPRPKEPNDETLTVLRGLGTTVQFSRGMPIFKERSHATAIYHVLAGAVALWQRTINGRRHIIDFRLPGEFFGLAYRPEYTVNAEAISDTIVIAYRRGQIDNLCDALPSFCRSITALLAEPVISRRDAILAENQTAKERIVDFLLAASHRTIDSDEVRLPFSDRDIAEHLELTCDIVARSLHDLEIEGIIAFPNANELVVIDGTHLKALVRSTSHALVSPRHREGRPN